MFFLVIAREKQTAIPLKGYDLLINYIRERIAMMCGGYRVFISALLVSALFLARAAAAEENITALYDDQGLTFMLPGEKSDDAALTQVHLTVNGEDLPAELVLMADKGSAPVMDSVRFTYPADAAPESRIEYVEIWVSPETEHAVLTRIYAGWLDENSAGPQISLTPYAATAVHIRFFNTFGGELATLPSVEIFGTEKARSLGQLPDVEDEEDWPYVIFSDEKPVGRFALMRLSGDDGGFRFASRSEQKLKLIDEDLSEEQSVFDLEINCEVNTDEELIITDFRCDFPQQDSYIIGESTMFRMKLQTKGLVYAVQDDFMDPRQASGKNNESIELSEGVPVVLPSVLYTAIARDGLVLGNEQMYDVLDVMESKLIRVRARVMEYFPAREGRADLYVVWFHDRFFEEFNRVALIEDDGDLLREYDNTMGYDMWRVDDPFEWEIEPRVLDFGQMLEEAIASLGDFIDMPDAVESARIHLRWNEMPPEMLDLEGPRQRVVSLEETEPGVFEAEIETIRRAYGDDPLTPSEELYPEEIASYLVYDNTVQTNEKKLIKLAAEIAGDAGEPLEKAERIYNWIIWSMSPKTVETFYVPPASAILKKKKGDCKHYAVMFATLARIAGVPTRFVFGQRYIGGTYGYHVWNQIYVDGEWLDIDATDLSFYPGALHVQMFTGPSFNDRAHTGAVLGFTPDPEISDAVSGTPDYSHVRSGTETVYDDSFLQDAYFKCRITYPGEMQRRVIDLGLLRKIEFTLPGEPKFHAAIYVFPMAIKGGINEIMNDWGKQEALHIYSLFGDMKRAKVHKGGDTQIDGREGSFFTGEFMDEHNEYAHFDVTFVATEDRTYLFHFVAPSAVFDKYIDKFNFIKRSIKIY